MPEQINNPSEYTTVRVSKDTAALVNGLPGSADSVISAMFKEPTKKVAPPSEKDEGVVFIGSQGTMYVAPTIDAEKISQFLENPYLKSALNSYVNIMFPGPAEVTAYNPQNDVDDELTEKFKAMLDKQTVRINELIKKSFISALCGGSCVINPAWEKIENAFEPGNFRVLPWSSFDLLPEGYEDMFSSIMPGIVMNDKGQVEAWQRQAADADKPTQIKNFALIKNPMDEGLAGDSKIVPLISILDMLKYSWNTEMQAANRAGSPVIFIKISNPQKGSNKNGGVSDVDYANMIIKNWSKSKQYTLRENMEVVEIGGKTTKNILETIGVLEQVINDYFSPTKLISKDGSHPLGSSGPELQLLNQAIQAEHRWLEDQFEQLLNRYFQYNAYPEGYRVKLHIPILEPDQSELNLKKVEAGIKGQAIDLDDMRELLGLDAADDEKRAKIAEFWQSQVSQQPAMFKESIQNKTHPYVKAIEEGEAAVDKELHASIDKAGDAILEALKEAEQ